MQGAARSERLMHSHKSFLYRHDLDALKAGQRVSSLAAKWAPSPSRESLFFSPAVFTALSYDIALDYFAWRLTSDELHAA